MLCRCITKAIVAGINCVSDRHSGGSMDWLLGVSLASRYSLILTLYHYRLEKRISAIPMSYIFPYKVSFLQIMISRYLMRFCSGSSYSPPFGSRPMDMLRRLFWLLTSAKQRSRATKLLWLSTSFLLSGISLDVCCQHKAAIESDLFSF